MREHRLFHISTQRGFEMKQKTILFAVAIMLVAQTVFAEKWDTQEVAFMEAFQKNDLIAMEKSLKERTSKTSFNVLLTSLIFGNVNDRSLPSVQLLIKYGTDCNETASTYFYYWNYLRDHTIAVTRLLIEKGYDINRSFSRSLLDLG